MHPIALLRTANFKLAAIYALLFGASVVVLAAVVYFRTTAEFERQDRLRMEAEGSALQSEYHNGGLTQLLDAIKGRQRGRVVGGLDYTVYDDHSVRIFGSLNRLPRSAGWTNILGPPDGDEAPGQLERLVVLTVPLAKGLWLSIGDDFDKFGQFGRVILETFGWALFLTVALAIGGGIALSAGFLWRVETITRTAEAIIGGDIHRRVPRHGTGDELDRLASTLNRMLDRISTLMDALRQVSNDIAHDLRTPLGRLRQTLDDARHQARSVGEYEAAVTTALADTDAVLETFSALLRIAQIEAGTRKAGFRDINLSAIVEAIVQTFSAIVEDAGKRLRTKVASGIRVSGDSELLVQLLVNLIENAIRHTPAGTTIDISLSGGRNPTLIIADNGAGIPEAERARVFERFHRLEQSRTTPGSGLGLSIVAAIADLHGVQIALEHNKPGLRVRLEFPAAALVREPKRAEQTVSYDQGAGIQPAYFRDAPRAS
jgi:signal transduction histidine kinase